MSNTYYHRQDKPILYLSAGELTGEYIGNVVYYLNPDDERAVLVPEDCWEKFYDSVTDFNNFHARYERNHKIIRLQDAILRGLSFNITKWVDDSIPF